MRIHRTPEVAAWWGPPQPGFPGGEDETTVQLTILHEGRVAGLIQFDEELDPHYRSASIDIFVDPALHRRGIARDALATLLRHLADARGHHRVTIDPAADNEAAIRCYEAVGFRRVGVMRSHWRDFTTGEWRDGLLMEWVRQPPPR